MSVTSDIFVSRASKAVLESAGLRAGGTYGGRDAIWCPGVDVDARQMSPPPLLTCRRGSQRTLACVDVTPTPAAVR